MRRVEKFTMGLVVLAVALIAGSNTAWATPAGQGTLPKPEIKQWSLHNGLDVAYMHLANAPVVTVQVWYHAGSKDEQRNRRGSAHMFEHIMFKGTTHVAPEEHARHIDRLGGTVNAFTNEDLTAYHNTLPKEYMDFAVRLEAERMRNLVFREDMIKTEREVVKEEIRQRENSPVQKAFIRFRELAYVAHPYSWDAGGRIADLNATQKGDLEKFYQAYYQPNNATLVVVGDVSEAEVRVSAEKWFGGLKRGAEPARPAKLTPEPKQEKTRREVAAPSQVGVIISGYKMPAASSDDVFALRVLANIMSAGDSSRLHRRVVRSDQTGVAAGVFALEFEDPGLLLVYGVHLAADQGPKVEAALQEEIQRLSDAKVSAAELTKAKNQIASRFVFGLQTASGIGFQIGTSKIIQGSATAWLSAYDKTLGVTADDVMRVAKTYLTPTNRTTVVVPPRSADKAGGK